MRFLFFSFISVKQRKKLSFVHDSSLTLHWSVNRRKKMTSEAIAQKNKL